jgi:ParB family chromosome partitioning protein
MSNEWYTPAKYIEAAREVMGGIDLDPASCEMANRVVQASKYYTQAENGLMHHWYGRVWCNPPYGRAKGSRGGKSVSHQQAFAEKLQLEYAAGNVEEAILLSLGNPNSLWFQPLLEYVVCFYLGHIDFYRPDGTTGDFGFPLAFVYLGPYEQKFIDIFSQFGAVVKLASQPVQRPITLDLWECEVGA